jgi:peptidoglycan/xylan/chitin deacetylase (PgdA/CDA1 family)
MRPATIQSATQRPVTTRPARTEAVSAVFPAGASAAVSLSFDDARASQLDGARMLTEHGLRATFYVLPSGLTAAPDRWRAVAGSGHELGNHSTTHPPGSPVGSG